MLDNHSLAFILGFIQGMSEFLPISSSGHLLVIHYILPEVAIDSFLFDIVLHLGTLAAVIVYFFSDLRQMLISWLKSFTGTIDEQNRLAWQIVIATIPAALVGYFLDDFIERHFRSTLVVAAMLIIGGVLFFLAEYFCKKTDDLKKLTWQKSLLIGIAQILAFIPGTSRSGITIIAGMSANLNREAAVRFSFLMSIPIILGANLKKIPDLLPVIFNGDTMISLLIGFFISYIVGYYVIKYFINFVKSYSLTLFAYYRFMLAIMIILLWLTI